MSPAVPLGGRRALETDADALTTTTAHTTAAYCPGGRPPSCVSPAVPLGGRRALETGADAAPSRGRLLLRQALLDVLLPLEDETMDLVRRRDRQGGECLRHGRRP